MIQRGTRTSKLAAVAIAFGPIVVLGLGFAGWAVASWVDAGRRISEAEAALHRIEARRSQAELYGPLGESWVEFAASSSSGLVQAPDRRTAAEALTTRVEELMTRADGATGVVSIFGAEEVELGLEVMRGEAVGRMPQAALPVFLDALEKDTPFLFVEFLDLRPARGGGAKVMDLRLRFVAYRMIGEPR